jgi:hypothetical protein
VITYREFFDELTEMGVALTLKDTATSWRKDHWNYDPDANADAFGPARTRSWP